MGVYMRGAYMPHDCLECMVAQFCKEYEEDDKRPYGCPLVEVKAPHGRLMSALTFIRMAKQELSENTVGDIQWLLGHVPTVIEAEDK